MAMTDSTDPIVSIANRANPPAINLSPPGQRGAGAANFTKGAPPVAPAGPAPVGPSTDPIAAIAAKVGTGQPSAPAKPFFPIADFSKDPITGQPKVAQTGPSTDPIARIVSQSEIQRAAGADPIGATPSQSPFPAGSVPEFHDGKDAARVAPSAPSAPPPDFNAAPTSIAGISKVTGKGIKSPIFTNLDPAQAASDYRTNQPNIAPTGAPQGGGAPQSNGINFGSGGGASGGSADLSAARAAAADRGDFDAVRNSYQHGAGTFNGETAQDTSNRESMASLSNAIQGARGKNKIALLAQQAGLINAQTTGKSAIAEAGLKAAQTGLAQADTAAKVQSTATAKANAAQVAKLQDQYASEADPIRQKNIGDQILTLLGHDPKQDAVQIATQDELVDPSNPALGVKKTPYLIYNRTGGVQRVEEAAAGGGIGKKPPVSATPPTTGNVSALTLNHALAPQFDAKYGAGSAAKIISGK